MDAREFIRMVIERSNGQEGLDDKIPDGFLKFNHCYMNLPVDAVEFLDVFRGLFDRANPKVWSSNGSANPATF